MLRAESCIDLLSNRENQQPAESDCRGVGRCYLRLRWGCGFLDKGAVGKCLWVDLQEESRKGEEGW